jgi:hypothetical protein
MTLAIQALLSLLQQLMPLLAGHNAVLIGGIISTLEQFLPFVIQEVSSLYEPVKNIIAALSANPATTAEQLAKLQVLDKATDDAFEAIAAETDAEGTPTS